MLIFGIQGAKVKLRVILALPVTKQLRKAKTHQNIKYQFYFVPKLLANSSLMW
jgi:hypothetical protein